MTTKHVYKAIIGVAAALAKEGIAKDKTCTQGASYKFRGIDDIYNALAPFLAEHNLCILPRMVSRECVERISKSGGALFYTTVEAEFDFVSGEDASMHTVKTFGEAMDSGDKGTNKAMSAAYKYAAFQSFCIPTEGDNDTENHTHEVQPKKTTSTKQPAKTETEMPAVNKTLHDELAAYCAGDTKIMDDTLKRLSYYKTGEGVEAKEYSFGLDRLPKTSEKWAGKVLAALRKAISDETKQDMPEVCSECHTPLVNGRCPAGCPF